MWRNEYIVVTEVVIRFHFKISSYPSLLFCFINTRGDRKVRFFFCYKEKYGF